MAKSLRYQSKVKPVSGRLVSAERLKLKTITSRIGVIMNSSTSREKPCQSRSTLRWPLMARSPQRSSCRKPSTTSSEQASTAKDMALPMGQLKPRENWFSMKFPIIAAPPPTKRGVT